MVHEKNYKLIQIYNHSKLARNLIYKTMEEPGKV